MDLKAQLVQQSWAKTEALGMQTVGVLFFKRIFDIAPEALQLFSFREEPNIYESEALKHHAISVLSTVGAAVAGLGDLQKLVPILEDLGKRHVNYGVKAEHYNIIGEALIDTLALSLGPAFTPEVKCEWMKVYSMVANTMKGDNYKVESLHGSADDWYMATDPRLRCAPPSSVERLHAVAKSKAAADDWYMGSSLTTATSRHNP